MMSTNRQKRLGQYFSGSKVAALLSDMIDCNPHLYAIDPMAGNGDMLYEIERKGCTPQNLYGIEIDPIAGSSCASRMPMSIIKVADAFSTDSISAFGRSSWDLVITNPPYVRYQTMEGFNDGKLSLQNAKSIRENLIKILRQLGHLTKEERDCFIRIAQNYSGLSDLAVPAWILCAALVAPNGTLAMVVPEAWLSREYALSIKYLLLKFFDIQYIVEDQSSTWFSDALVKTNLLVAKRVSYRTVFPAKSLYKRISIDAQCEDDNSLVGKMILSENSGETAFKALLDSSDSIAGTGYSMKVVSIESMITDMYQSRAFAKLYSRLECSEPPVITTALPQELSEAVERNVVCELNDLCAWGFSIGQGLRTGANKFFYAESEGEDGLNEHLYLSDLFTNRRITVQKRRVMPVLRYQADIQNRLTVNSRLLRHRLLYIEDELTVADSDLAKHIVAAEKVDIISAGKQTHLQNLSAVKPNVRISANASDSQNRHWYMLPKLMSRHIPSLCVSRVNYKESKCLLLGDSGVVVDANFSTLWMEAPSRESITAVFALLNSSWVKAYLETISTVMGGGALKVEASHIRQLLLPTPTPERVGQLCLFGEMLINANAVNTEEVVDRIDLYLLTQLFGDNVSTEDVERLKVFLRQKVANRQR